MGIALVASRKSRLLLLLPLRLWPGAAKAEPYDEMRDEKGSQQSITELRAMSKEHHSDGLEDTAVQPTWAS